MDRLLMHVFADDADYASKATGRRSVSAGVMLCGGVLGALGFQNIEVRYMLSATAPEYVAMVQTEISDISAAGLIFYLSYSRITRALRNSRNKLVTSSVSKHIGVRYHFQKGKGWEENDLHGALYLRSAWRHADILKEKLSAEESQCRRNFVISMGVAFMLFRV